MFRSNQRRDGMASAIFGLWRNWAFAVGLLTMLTMLAPVLPLQWLVLVNMAFYLVLQLVRIELQNRDIPSCSRLIQQVSAVILITAVTLILFYLYVRDNPISELTGQPYSLKNSPIIVILLTAPIASAVTLIFGIKRKEPLVCQRCKMRYGNVIEHGFVGDIYRKEWRYQTSLLFWLSLALSIIDWIYYLGYYVNTNLSDSDLFFFIWMPLAIYSISIIYLGLRYYFIWVYYCRNDERHIVERPGSSSWRFLVIAGDRILMKFDSDTTACSGCSCAMDSDIKRYDSPVVVRTSYRERNDENEALRLFVKHTGVKNVELHSAYESPDSVTYHNLFHYLAFVDSEDGFNAYSKRIKGQWLTWGELVKAAENGKVSRDLISEMKRLYQITMACKTYNLKGQKLYNIKHYRPTFHLRDLRNPDVDYNDFRWLYVSRCNEDNFWYPLRRYFMPQGKIKTISNE